ncbi:MAG: hypothetical protein ACTSPV_10895 [Candidatus Hodarchaeales archaeon]
MDSSLYKEFLSLKRHFAKLGITIYEIGGTYLQGMTSEHFTRDIDFVLLIDETEKEVIDAELYKIGYSFIDSTKHPFRYISKKGVKLDVFFNRVFSFRLTRSMVSRVKGGKLAPEDFFLFKIQSSLRTDKDLTDLELLILNLSKFDPKIVIEELKSQLPDIKLDSRTRLSLARIQERVYKLNQKFPLKIPTYFLNEVERILSKYI